MVRNFVLVSGAVILAAGTALATDAPKLRYVEVSAPSPSDNAPSSETRTEQGGEHIVIQRFGPGKDGRRSIERHFAMGGPGFPFQHFSMNPHGQTPGTVVRCTRTDQAKGPDGETRYQLNCTERKLGKGESIYVMPEAPMPPMPPVPGIAPVPPMPPEPSGS
jgi:hypothetical protein